MRFTAPNSRYGALRKTPVFAPWPVASGSRTWTPLIPPGSEGLGSTELPPSPSSPAVLPGTTTIPVSPGNTTLPIPDTTELVAQIPGFGDGGELPSPELVFAGPPVEPLEVGPYRELRGRSKLDGLDIDDIVSQAALRRYIRRNFPALASSVVNDYLLQAPSVAIPSEIHRKYSETYGGRNSEAKQLLDAENLRAAVDSSIDAIKRALLKAGFSESQIELTREKLHQMNSLQGWYS